MSSPIPNHSSASTGRGQQPPVAVGPTATALQKFMPVGSAPNNNMASTGRGPVEAGPTATGLQKFGAGPDRSMISMSDENMMMKQILETHAPDYGLDIDVKPLLFLVEDILKRATMTSDETSAKIENNSEKAYQAALMLTVEALSHTIDRVSCELESKALGRADAHATTHSILKMLSSFSWEAKLVLALAAFAFNYGEFWLLAQMYSSNQLAKSMAILKQLPSIMDHMGPGPVKARFDALNRLIRAMVEVTECVVKVMDFPPNYVSTDFPALSGAVAHVPTATYWTVRSAVACASQIASLTNAGHEHVTMTSEAWELSSLEQRLKNIAEHLKQQINLCDQHIDEKRSAEAYQKLGALFEAIHADNMKILKALICPKEDVQPLVDGSTKKRVDIDVLRRKHVLLLISGLDIAQEELSILEQIHNESKQHSTRHEIPYEVVWIPIIDTTITNYSPESVQKRFESIQATMPWFSVFHPSLIDKVAVRFIKEVWHFKYKPILVVLDPQGKVVSPNAIHMMWIWGSNAFPFTTYKEETLWRDESWGLELLVDGMDQNVLTWGREGKYIFLYGGADMEWIRRFTATARQVASAAKIPLEMVYVGKSGKREPVKKTVDAVIRENLSHCWEDLTLVWFFWTRLESMLFSKIQLEKDDDRDHIMQGIKKLLSYDKVGSWAILVHGSTVVVQGHSSTVLPALNEYDIWKDHVPTKGYDLAFKDHHDKLQSLTQPCSRFEFPTVGRVPNQLKCPECHSHMEKLISFLCCHDEASHVPSIYEA